VSGEGWQYSRTRLPTLNQIVRESMLPFQTRSGRRPTHSQYSPHASSSLSWAASSVTLRVGKGQRLLADNPLHGVKNVREDNPRRPVAKWERFTKTREAARQLGEREDATPAERMKWLQLELCLVLAEATGRRLGSIRQLRWDD
jgi:hypothetical protein